MCIRARLYTEARAALEESNWTDAKDYYTKLEARYPFGTYAQQAQIELIYANWKDGDAAQAVQGADRFLQAYPNHANSDYVMYLKALATLNENDGWFAKLAAQDLAERDANAAQEAVSYTHLVHAAHVGGDFDGALGIKEGEKALAGADAVMVAARRADLKAGAERFRVKRLLAARTLGPDAFGNRTRLALVVVLALDLGENVRNPAHKLFISGSSAPCRATAGTDRFKTAPIISPGRNPKGAPRIGFTD